jgi:hypothetical protein
MYLVFASPGSHVQVQAAQKAFFDKARIGWNGSERWIFLWDEVHLPLPRCFRLPVPLSQLKSKVNLENSQKVPLVYLSLAEQIFSRRIVRFSVARQSPFGCRNVIDDASFLLLRVIGSPEFVKLGSLLLLLGLSGFCNGCRLSEAHAQGVDHFGNLFFFRSGREEGFFAQGNGPQSGSQHLT